MAKTKKNKSLRGRKKRGGTKGTRISKIKNDFNSGAFFDVLKKYSNNERIDDVRTYIDNLTSFTQMNRNIKKTVVGTLLWYWSDGENYENLIRDVIDDKRTKPEDITRHTLRLAVQRNNPEFVQLLVDKMSEENKHSNLDVSLCSNNEAIMDILEEFGVFVDAKERGNCKMNDMDTSALATQHAFNKLKETGKINEHVPLDVLPEMREYMTSRWDW